MTVAEIKSAILRLKREKDVCILAHAYQCQDILEVADFVGDSYGLSVQASKAPQKQIVMCGVRFMAETCKVLCPGKSVYLPNPVAGCPMADQLTPEALHELQIQYPDYTTVAYINTTSALKCLAEVCVTSASAVKVCKALDTDKILFVPDPNLGKFVAEQIPEKQFAFYNGGCPRHFAMTKEDVDKARLLHPNAKFLVHPECKPEVVREADFVGSTTAIMDYAQKSADKEFIIGTENSIVEHLQYACPGKKFYPLSVNLTCVDMRVTTLMDVYNCLRGEGGEEITLPADVMEGAKRCINNMIELGK